MIASERPGAVVYVLLCSPTDHEDLGRTHLAVANAFEQLIADGVKAMSISAHMRESAVEVLTASRKHPQ